MNKQYWPNEEWEKREPEVLGMNGDRLRALDEMIGLRYGNINGIVVLKKGYIIFERYYNGSTASDKWHVASVTKSIISALFGIALDNGYIQNTEQKVLSFFPEYKANEEDMLKRTITLKHILTMTAPFPFSWREGNKRGTEPLDRLRRQKDWTGYILNIMAQNGLPSGFQYYTAGPHLLSAIITRTTGMCAREFANQRLFDPIGMGNIDENRSQTFGLEDYFGKRLKGWPSDPNGNTLGGWGLSLTARDMARFGLLYLRRGKWKDTQIISEKWITESTARSVSFKLSEYGLDGYGYLWWLRSLNGTDIFSAMGDGGNVICCIPEKDIVVAIASKLIMKPLDRWPLIEEYIL